MFGSIGRVARDTSGSTMIEYVMIAAVIALGVIPALLSIGSTLSRFFAGVANGL